MKKTERKWLEEHDKQVLKDREAAGKPQGKQLEKWARTYANKVVDDKYEKIFNWILIGLAIVFFAYIFINDASNGESVTRESFFDGLIPFLILGGSIALIIWFICSINGDTRKIIGVIILSLIIIGVAIAIGGAIGGVAGVVVAILILRFFHII